MRLLSVFIVGLFVCQATFGMPADGETTVKPETEKSVDDKATTTTTNTTTTTTTTTTPTTTTPTTTTTTTPAAVVEEKSIPFIYFTL